MSDSLFWDTDEPYQYFRRLDDATVILGGGDRPASTPFDPNEPHAALRGFLDKRLTGSYEVTHQWSGTLFETTDGLPYVAEHPHHPGRVFFATGFGGNGMVMGTLAGRMLADLVTRRANAHAPLFALARTGASIAAAGPSAPITDSAASSEIALFPIGGEVHAIDNVCSHAGGPLCEGSLDGAVVTCPWHGSKFDVTTGAVQGGPASRPQRCYRARVSATAKSKSACQP
jgi:nitrite reductase/ring-hydroxylating ferredoxin subunit